MSGLSWEQATVILYKEMGVELRRSPKRKQKSLLSAIRSVGLRVRKARTEGGELALEKGTVAVLLQAGKNEWYPVLVSKGELFLLNEEGRATQKVTKIDVKNKAGGWVFYRPSSVSLKRILPFFFKFKSPIAKIFASSFLVNLFSLTLPLFSCFVYDKILGNNIPETLWALVIGLSFVLLIDFCVRIIRTMSAEAFSQRCESDIDASVIESLFNIQTKNLPTLSAFLDKYKQILMNRDFLSSSYLLALVDIPFLFLFLAAVAYTAGFLVFVPVVFGLLILVVSWLTTMPMPNYEKMARIFEESRMRSLTDLITAHEVVSKTHMRGEIGRRWHKDSAAASAAKSKLRYWRSFGNALTSTLTFAAYIAVVVGGVYMVDAGMLTSGGLLACSILSSRAMSNFSSMTLVFLRYREFKTAARELREILPEQKEELERTSRGKLQGNINLQNITCNLGQGNVPVLKNINLKIKAGELVGIAGAPGAGKTTLLRLVAGVLSPDEGVVLLDDIPLSQLSHSDMAENIGYKPQETSLFDGTIEENVQAGRPPLSALQREYVLMASGLKQAFDQSGLNWTTKIGPAGSHLSGGQRQLVAIARAIAGVPSVLLLDEPTNGLGSVLENRLAEFLQKHKGKNTMLVSTHSKAVLSQCDRIIVVGQSRILADGPRDKVLVA